MTANNQGIDHIALRAGGFPLCKRRDAHMSIAIETFRVDGGTGRYCKRCVAKLAKMDELKARAAARQQVA